MNLNPAFQMPIPKQKGCCSSHLEELAPGMHIYSVLIESEDREEYIRHDYCPLCWDALSQSKQSFITIWKSKIPIKPNHDRSQKKMAAVSLLKDLLKQGKGKEAEAFILSLYLQRKKIINLKGKKTLENGAPALQYEVIHDKEELYVPSFAFSELPLRSLEENLANQLKSIYC